MMNLILTCEHASNRVPAAYQHCFRGMEKVLAGHRGWDPGASLVAKIFKREFSPQPPLFETNVTRLLVEPNRSLGHANLFSEFTRDLSDKQKSAILAKFYFPHRNAVHQWIAENVSATQPVLHLSIHSFTPKLEGETRNADIGLLYDPRRQPEKVFSRRWLDEISQQRPGLKVRRNYPYRGVADGLTTWLRKQFSPDQYLGIELEFNQLHLASSKSWQEMSADVARLCPR